MRNLTLTMAPSCMNMNSKIAGQKHITQSGARAIQRKGDKANKGARHKASSKKGTAANNGLEDRETKVQKERSCEFTLIRNP